MNSLIAQWQKEDELDKSLIESSTKILKKCKKSSIEIPIYLNIRANCYCNLHQFGNAIADIESAISFISKNKSKLHGFIISDIYTTKGFILAKQKRYPEAIKEFEYSLEILEKEKKHEKNLNKILPDKPSVRKYYKKSFDDRKNEILGYIESSKKGMTNPVSSPCFIATEVYGESSYQVSILKKWRDEYLLNKILGRVFVKIYYFFSRKLICIIHNNKSLRKFFRIFIDILIKLIRK
jgi:tetratricopeptide (TPR) repeat protein